MNCTLYVSSPPRMLKGQKSRKQCRENGLCSCREGCVESALHLSGRGRKLHSSQSEDSLLTVAMKCGSVTSVDRAWQMLTNSLLSNLWVAHKNYNQPIIWSYYLIEGMLTVFPPLKASFGLPKYCIIAEVQLIHILSDTWPMGTNEEKRCCREARSLPTELAWIAAEIAFLKERRKQSIDTWSVV